MKLEVGAKTDVGLVRDHNEDSFCVNLKNRIFIVADGMGGHAAGEVASNQLKDYIEEFILRGTEPETIDRHLQEAVQRANQHIFDMGLEDPAKRGMGTTATILVLTEDLYYVAQVGDSRCYLFRNGELQQLTRDHSKVFQLYEHGLITKEEIETHPFSNIITRSIGTKRTVEADIYRGAVREGDRFMLCSDGLSGEVNDAGVAEVLRDKLVAQEASDELVRRTLRNGGRDNVTVLVVDVMARSGQMRRTVPISKKDVERILAAEERKKQEAAAAAASSSSPSPPPPSPPSPPSTPSPAPAAPPAPAYPDLAKPAPRRSVLTTVLATALLTAIAVGAVAYVATRSGGGCPVTVDTLPPGAELYVNGDLAGKTPCVVLLPPGEHTLNARLDGFKGTKLYVKVKPGEDEPKRKLIPLEREGASGP